MSPTREQLEAEEVWQRQRIPLMLSQLRTKLMLRLLLSDEAVGIMGDIHHLFGYHRSRAWIEHSQYCTNRLHSVTETPGNRDGGSDNHVAGMDISVPTDVAHDIYARLRAARAQGRLPMLRQIILESSPPHIHLSFDRGMLGMDMQPILDAINGVAIGGEKMVTLLVAMPELQEGSEGSAVTTAQTLANLRGADLRVDGVFGPKTRAGIIFVQTRFGAEAIDGIVGPETWTILLSGEDQN